MLVKQYGAAPDTGPARRYSPAVCTGALREPIMGNPDERTISTSYAERANLSIRMNQRRFTRLTNGFSKKVENHVHSLSLWFMYYNFCRSHQTLTRDKKGIHTTPAMAAGITDHRWTLEEVLSLLSPPSQLAA